MELSKLEQYEKELEDSFRKIDGIAYINQKKILNAFQDNNVSLRHFNGTTGYGNDDVGKDTLNRVFAQVFECEKAIVSPYLSCGTHSLFLALSSVLRPNDKILSITGAPYDTLVDCIKGVNGEDTGSLKDYGVDYYQVELKDDCLDEEEILKQVKLLNPKLVYMQRSRGYSWRSPLSVKNIGDIISKIKQINKDCLFFVDNCYGEFVEEKEPTFVGADLVVGSMCKNPGGGIVPNGGYIAGTRRALDLVEKRLTAPTIGLEVGSYEPGYRLFYQGLFLAPQAVKNSLKGTSLIAKIMESAGYDVLPASNETSYDIIRSIKLKNEQELVSFVQLIQSISPVDSQALPMPWDMPGYNDKVIMAAGTFVQGASIEMSCDSPIKAPYIAYMQGGLTYEHIKIVAEKLINKYGL